MISGGGHWLRHTTGDSPFHLPHFRPPSRWPTPPSSIASSRYVPPHDRILANDRWLAAPHRDSRLALPRKIESLRTHQHLDDEAILGRRADLFAISGLKRDLARSAGSSWQRRRGRRLSRREFRLIADEMGTVSQS